MFAKDLTNKNATKAALAKAGEPQGKGKGNGGSKGKSAHAGGKAGQGKASGAADGGQTKRACLFYLQGLCRRGSSCLQVDAAKAAPAAPTAPQITKAQPAAKPKAAVAKAAVAMLALSGSLEPAQSQVMDLGGYSVEWALDRF